MSSSSSESESEVEIKVKGRPKAKKNTFITLDEKFNQHKLNYIIKNKDTLKNSMRTKCFEDDYDPFAIANKYLNKSNNGTIITKYKQNASYGRFYAVGSLSLQSLPREIRHTIANEFYIDIDIKNAHPVILAHICNMRDIPCRTLKKYNKNRDEYLNQISSDKDTAKTVILSIINGGKKAVQELKEEKPEWLDEFKKEIEKIHKKFATDREFKTHKKKRENNGIDYNHEASYMNTILCDYENDILQIIYKGLNNPKNCVLCFDGLMVLKETQFNIQELEELVEDKMGIDIKLIIKEMKDGFEIEQFDTYIDKPKNTFDFNDTYTYSEFYNQYNGQDAENILDDVIDDLQRVIVHCNKGEGSYIKKSKNGTFDIVKKLGSSGLELKTNKAPLKLDNIIKSSFIRSFAGINCILDESKVYDDFNIWSGFQAKRVEIVNGGSEGFNLMKSFIMECWADNNEEHYNYMISWFAGLFTNLKSINKVALAMISPQGTGKGTLIEFMEFLLRESHVVSISGVNEITGKFNALLQGKRLVNINEMSATKEEFKSNFDKIKSYITDPTMKIEPKGVDSYTINNISNYILFTNHRDAIIVEESDRRYGIFEMGTKYINNTEYFGNIRNKCFNQDVANEFYTYLLDFPAVNIAIIPNTAIKDEMRYMSRHNVLKFIDNIFEDENYKESIFHGMSIKALQLYINYKNWCIDNGERNVVSNTKFGSLVDNRIIKTRTNSGNMYAIA